MAISEATEGEYNDLVRNCGLILVPETFPDSYYGTEVPAFHWSDETEPQQEDRYLAHLARIIPLRERHLNGEQSKRRPTFFRQEYQASSLLEQLMLQ